MRRGKVSATNLFLCQRERVAHELGTVADEHLHQLGAGELEVGRVCLRRARASEQRLSDAGGPIHEHALRRFDAELFEAIRVRHGQNDCLNELLNLLVQAADVAVRFRRTLIHLHRLDARVKLGGQRLQDEVRILVDADQVARLELVGGDEADDGEEDRLARRRLEHDGLALPLRIEINVSPILLVLLHNVQNFDDVADEVRKLLVELDLLRILLDLLVRVRLFKLQPLRLGLEHLDLRVKKPRARQQVLRARAQKFLVKLLVLHQLARRHSQRRRCRHVPTVCGSSTAGSRAPQHPSKRLRAHPPVP